MAWELYKLRLNDGSLWSVEERAKRSLDEARRIGKVFYEEEIKN
jgi:hypothetical protein